MDTDSLIVYIKTENIYTDIAKDVEARSDSSTYDRLLPKGENKKVIGVMKDESGGEIIKEFAALRAKTCNYLTDNNH